MSEDSPVPEPIALPAPDPTTAPAVPEPPPGHPYRPEPLAIAQNPFAAPRRAHPILGPALSLFALLLWSFVVFGQFTTSWMSGGPLPNGVAIAAVAAITFAGWLVGLRRSRASVTPRTAVHFAGRAIGIGLLAFLLFLAAIFVSMIIGSAGPRNHDFGIAFFLVLTSLVAAIVGLRWTWTVPPERSRRQQTVWKLLWAAGVLLTIVAGAELAIVG
jgi:hypothetical protein